MTFTQSLSAGLATYEVTAHTNERTGQAMTWARNGHRLASITQEPDGRLRVALFLDYGADGRTWCDGATYKTPSGAVRKVRGFLR